MKSVTYVLSVLNGFIDSTSKGIFGRIIDIGIDNKISVSSVLCVLFCTVLFCSALSDLFLMRFYQLPYLGFVLVFVCLVYCIIL